MVNPGGTAIRTTRRPHDVGLREMYTVDICEDGAPRNTSLHYCGLIDS